MAHESEKELAGRAAAKLVRDGEVVGLGTGSTAHFAIVALGERVQAGLKITGIPTSIATEHLARKLFIPLGSLDEHPAIDITIDGADEIDPQINLIKGGGGALLREKVIASVSKKMVVAVDSTKLVPKLGKFPLPIEIIPFAQPVVERKLVHLGATAKLRLKPDGQPYVTDNGNHILDASFGRIGDPPSLARALSDTPGIVEHGLFIGFARLALVGKGSVVRQVRPKQPPTPRRDTRPRLSSRAKPDNHRTQTNRIKGARPKRKRRQS
jgi:ribose 5-phosphate isomerase A